MDIMMMEMNVMGLVKDFVEDAYEDMDEDNPEVLDEDEDEDNFIDVYPKYDDYAFNIWVKNFKFCSL